MTDVAECSGTVRSMQSEAGGRPPHSSRTRMTETCAKDGKQKAATQRNKGSSSDSKSNSNSKSIGCNGPPSIVDMTPASGTTNAFAKASSDAFKAQQTRATLHLHWELLAVLSSDGFVCIA